jgi:hypothetical protein
MLSAVKHRLAFALLYSEQLIELVDLCTDIFRVAMRSAPGVM